MYEFVLYVSKSNQQTEKSFNFVNTILKKNLNDNFHLSLINVVDYPEEANKDNILMTPTLVKKIPLPIKKIIGDMSKIESIIDTLIQHE